MNPLRFVRSLLAVVAARYLGRAWGRTVPSGEEPEAHARTAADRLFLALAEAGVGVSDVRAARRHGAWVIEVHLVPGGLSAAVPTQAGGVPVLVCGAGPGTGRVVIPSTG